MVVLRINVLYYKKFIYSGSQNLAKKSLAALRSHAKKSITAKKKFLVDKH